MKHTTIRLWIKILLIFVQSSSSRAKSSLVKSVGDRTCALYDTPDLVLKEAQMDESSYTWSFHGKVRMTEESRPCSKWRRDTAACLTMVDTTHPFQLAEPVTVIKTSHNFIDGHSSRLSGTLVAARATIFLDGKICSKNGTPENAKWNSVKVVVRVEGLKWENLKFVSNGLPTPMMPNVVHWLRNPAIWLIQKAVREEILGRLHSDAVPPIMYQVGLDSI